MSSTQHVATKGKVTSDLTKAFTRSTSTKSRIKGMRDYTQGFNVYAYAENVIHVTDQCRSMDRGDTAKQRSYARLDQYAEHLTSLGYTVTQQEVGIAGRRMLIVSL